MSEAKKRKVHSAEFKAKVGVEALKGEKTINEIGQAYGVHPALVGQCNYGDSLLNRLFAAPLCKSFLSPTP